MQISNYSHNHIINMPPVSACVCIPVYNLAHFSLRTHVYQCLLAIYIYIYTFKYFLPPDISLPKHILQQYQQNVFVIH